MKVFPLTKKLSEFPVKSLMELRAGMGMPETRAYVAAVIPNQDNYLIPVTDFNKVYHDNTLVGDGSPEFPLSVVGGGSGSGSSGSSGCGGNVSINSPMNTIIVTQPAQYTYNLEGTNWGYRYNIAWDKSSPVATLNNIDGLIETEIIHEIGDPALKFELNNGTSDVVTNFYVLTAANDRNPRLVNSFTGNFTYNVDPDLIGNYYSFNIEASVPTVAADYSIDVYTGTVTKGSQPEELIFKSEYLALQQRVAALEQQNREYEELVRRVQHIEDRLPPEYLYYDNVPVGYGDDNQPIVG